MDEHSTSRPNASQGNAPDCTSCSACPGHEESAAEGSDDSLLTGWKLGLASAGLFLGPVVLAIAGAFWAGNDPGGQLLGALGGLALGILVAAIVVRCIRGRSSPHADRCP